MSTDNQLSDLLSALQNTLKLQSAMMAKFEQREARMQSAFDQRMQALQNGITQIQGRVDGIVGEAGLRIADQARNVLAPVAAQYERDVSATSTQLQRANKIVLTWFGAAGAVSLLVLFVGWMVLGYYRRELASTKENLGRHENAVPIVQAFYASDVVICDGRICSNNDPDGKRVGDKRQFRPAKPRPSQ